MSQKMYDGILRKWKEFLEWNIDKYIYSESISSDEATGSYDDASSDFCKENGYVERTEEMAFHGIWYDTMVDEFYNELEKKGVTIKSDKGGSS